MEISLISCGDHRRSHRAKSENHLKKPELNLEIIGPVDGPHAAAMRNHGASLAEGEWLCFLDADCAADPEILRSSLHRWLKLDPPECSALGGLYDDSFSAVSSATKAYSWIQKAWVMASAIIPEQTGFVEVENLLGGCLILRRRDWKKIGGFRNEIGWAGEETAFLRTLVEAGGKLYLDPQLKVAHARSLDWSGFLFRAYRQGRSRGLYSLQTRTPGFFAQAWHSFLSEPMGFRVRVMIGMFFSALFLANGLGVMLRWMSRAKPVPA